MVVNVDGSDRHALNGEAGAGSGDWSPDGKTILTEATGATLVLVPADGGPSVPFTFEVAAEETYHPAWSPDGGWIICTRLVSTGLDIFIVRKDGTDLHQVTRTNGMAEEFGTWQILPQ
jgi:Tol biopolymer transport system component